MSLTQINKAGLDELALDHVFTIGASGSSAYTFQGEGLNGTVNNPTLYLTRGKTYRFENGSGGHPIRIQSTSGASGTAYNTGVTNNAGSGTVIVEVQHDAPDVLYYQCTSHAAMNGILYITGALADGGVTTAKIADNAVTRAKITDGEVISAKLDSNAVTTSKINNNAVTTSKIADSQITTAKINDSAVTTAKIADDAVTVAKLANPAVNTVALYDNAVTTAKILDSNVTTAKIADQAVTLAKLPHGTSSNDGKFLRANNGADPSFETVTSTTINNNADNRVITGSGTANTLEAESTLTFDGNNLGITGVAPQITLTESNADPDYNIIANAGTLNINDSTNSVTKLSISSTKMSFPVGPIGFGTSTPDDNFHFLYNNSTTYSTSIGNSGLQIENSNGTDETYAQIHLRDGNADSYIRSVRKGSNAADLVFLVDNGNTNTQVTAEGLRIDSGGRVTKPLAPSYFAYSTTTQNHSNSAFINPGGWDVSNVGRHNIGSHFNTSNTTFTAPIAGRYLVSMQYSFWYGADVRTDGHQLRLQINNAGANEYFLQGGLGNGCEGLVYGSAIVNLSANDTVRWKHDGYGGSGYYNIFTTFGYLLG